MIYGPEDYTSTATCECGEEFEVEVVHSMGTADTIPERCPACNGIDFEIEEPGY